MLILISLIVASDLRGVTTVVIDNKNTVRLGSVVLPQNKKVRDSVLRIVSHLNGAKFAIVADRSAKWSTIIEVMDSMGRARATAVPPR